MKTIITMTLLLSSAAMAGRYNDVVYVDVIDAQPIIETISVPERREICERFPEQHGTRKHSHGGGALLGAVIGGVIGNRFGKGNGRKAATAAGVMIGAGVGAEKERRRHNHHGVETRCYIDTVYREEEQLVGYDVSYRYDGELRYVQLQDHPGDKLKLRVDVAVIE